MMEIFRGKAKGGEGLHAELQYHPKLKNLNGIEAFLGALAGKKLSDENLDKVAKELPNLASRIAVVGSLTHELPQEKNVAEWRTRSRIKCAMQPTCSRGGGTQEGRGRRAEIGADAREFMHAVSHEVQENLIV